MCSIKAKKYSTIYGGGETEVLVIKLQFVVAHLCAKVTRNKLRGNFFLAKNHALILNKTTPAQNDFVPPSAAVYFAKKQLFLFIELMLLT